MDAQSEILGKKAGDLIEKISLVIRDEKQPTYATVLGTSKYVTNYDLFEPGASGNFFPFNLGESAGSIMSMKRRDGGGHPYTGPVDTENVIKIEKGQIWDITIDDEPVVSFDFSEINCESAKE